MDTNYDFDRELIIQETWQTEVMHMLQERLNDTRLQLKNTNLELLKTAEKLQKKEDEIDKYWKIKIEKMNSDMIEFRNELKNLKK